MTTTAGAGVTPGSARKQRIGLPSAVTVSQRVCMEVSLESVGQSFSQSVGQSFSRSVGESVSWTHGQLRLFEAYLRSAVEGSEESTRPVTPSGARAVFVAPEVLTAASTAAPLQRRRAKLGARGWLWMWHRLRSYLRTFVRKS